MSDQHADLDTLQAEHDEAVAASRRAFFAVLSISLFCIITVFGKQDKDLLVGHGEIKLPIINFEMDYGSFIFFAPILLVGFQVYLFIYLDLSARTARDRVKRRATIFTMDSAVARKLSVFLVYWLVPITLGITTWETWPLGVYGWPFLVFTLIVTAGICVIPYFCPRMHGHPEKGYQKIRHVGWNFLFLLFFVTLLGQTLHYRQWELRYFEQENLDIENADFSRGDLVHAKLIGANLPSVRFHAARLQNVDLSQATLTGLVARCADFSGSTLEGASLDRAKLERSRLTGVKGKGLIMNGALLLHSDFRDSEFNGVKFKSVTIVGTSFERAEMQGADFANSFLDDVDFTGADLTGAKFTSAELQSVVLTGAKLDDVDFEDTYFNNVDLRGADLSKTNIDEAQLGGAYCDDATTVLPIDVERGKCKPGSEYRYPETEAPPGCEPGKGFWLIDYLTKTEVDE